MYVYRISKWKYLEDLSGTGARLVGGRWNKPGTPLVYTASYLSLATLELMANQMPQFVDSKYGYVKINIPSELNLESISKSHLYDEWRTKQYIDQTIELGTIWASELSTVGLIVPSAVLAQEKNILLNPMHPDFNQINIVESGPLELDPRVIKTVI